MNSNDARRSRINADNSVWGFSIEKQHIIYCITRTVLHIHSPYLLVSIRYNQEIKPEENIRKFVDMARGLQWLIAAWQSRRRLSSVFADLHLSGKKSFLQSLQYFLNKKMRFNFFNFLKSILYEKIEMSH